jgi:hypothetical protein
VRRGMLCSGAQAADPLTLPVKSDPLQATQAVSAAAPGPRKP